MEVRICDAQATAAESEALAGLIVACVAQAARDVDEGVPFTDPEPRMVEENMWRAIRFGLDGRLIDIERVEEYPAREAIERLASWTRPGARGARHRAGLPRAQRRSAPARDDRGGRRPRGGLRGVGGGDQSKPTHRRWRCEHTGGPAGRAGGAGAEGQPSEAELSAAYEAELSRITSADMVLQATVSLLNIGARRLGLVGGPDQATPEQGSPERDLEQVRDAIDAVRGLMGVVERRAPQEARPLRDALSQLQMAYARESQGPPAQGPPAQGPPAQGLPAQGLPAQGPPAQGPPAQGPPAQGPPAQGPPAQGPPAQGAPAPAAACGGSTAGRPRPVAAGRREARAGARGVQWPAVGSGTLSRSRGRSLGSIRARGHGEWARWGRGLHAPPRALPTHLNAIRRAAR